MKKLFKKITFEYYGILCYNKQEICSKGVENPWNRLCR